MKQVFIILLFAISASLVQAQSAFFSKGGAAIGGYDPVAYFADAPSEGFKKFSYTWQGIEWHFKSQSSLEAFKANPEKYAPQFGGYCAYGASQNHKAPTDPLAYTIVDNKLYLNYNLKVKEMWAKDTKGNIVKAEANWAALRDAKE